MDEVKKPKKHKLTEEELKALLGKTCHGRQWFLMKKTADYNKLALFLKINGVDRIELGQKAYTYEVDLRDETIAGAFIVTERPVGEGGTRWYIAAAVVAPDYRGHDIGSIMVKKMKTLVKAEGADAIYVDVPEDALPPDDIKDARANDAEAIVAGAGDAEAIVAEAGDAGSARVFWKAEGFVEWDNGLYVSTLSQEEK